MHMMSARLHLRQASDGDSAVVETHLALHCDALPSGVLVLIRLPGFSGTFRQPVLDLLLSAPS